MGSKTTASWVAILAAVTLCGGACEAVCGRQLVFDLLVTDDADLPVPAAEVDATCIDTNGAERTPESGLTPQTDSDGYVSFRVTAPNRDCPKRPTLSSSYFSSCTLTVEASGFQPLERPLTGEELDALAPDEDFPDGNHIPLTLALSP